MRRSTLLLCLLIVISLFQTNPAATETITAVQSPVLLAPAHGSTAPYNGPVPFDWADVAGATGYAIELLSDQPENPNGTAPSRYRLAAAVCPGGASGFNGETNGLAEGRYWWRALAIDGQGSVSAFSDAWSFTVPPPRPYLAAPADSLQVINKGPMAFDWTDVPGATVYGIELMNAPPEAGERNNAVGSVHRIAAATSAPGVSAYQGDTSGLPDGTYWWRAVAFNAQGTYGVFSDARSFKIPPRPVLYAPADGLNQPVPGGIGFDWSDIPGATSYGLELLSAPPENPNGTDASRYRVVATAVSASQSSYGGDTSGLAGGTYWWRVIAANDQGYVGVFSDAKSFTVPVRPLLSSPGNGTIVSSRGPLDFTWAAVPGATGYAIELMNGAPENPYGTTASVYRIAADVVPGGPATSYPGNTGGMARGTYYWRVIALRNGQFYGIFSSAYGFTVLNRLSPPLGPLTYSLLGDYAPGERSDHGTGYGTPGSIPGHNVWIPWGDAYDMMCGSAVSVFAAHNGVVTEKGSNFVILQGDGFTTVYGHVTSSVGVGQALGAGQYIGVTDSVGHLHFELWDGSTPIVAGDIPAYF